jgi:medium-chain acyl-[acyl-carrier-protein] hydrolase
MGGPATTSSVKWFWPAPVRLARGCRLFCLPFAGGSAAAYRAWTADGIPGIQAVAVQLPGRGTRLLEEPYRRIEPLTRALADAFAPLVTEPYALFGHSMGALIGFELARELRRRGLPAPRRLYVSARRAPHLPPTKRGIHLLSDSAFLDELRELGGTPPDFFTEPELVRLALPALRADFELCDAYTYRPEAPLACPITALGGTQDAGVPADVLRAWREHTAGAFQVHLFPGGHFYLFDADSTPIPLIGRDLADGSQAVALPD